MESKTFRVPNIGCNGCVRTIQTEVAQVPRVKSVKAILRTCGARQSTAEWAKSRRRCRVSPRSEHDASAYSRRVGRG